MDDYLVIPHNRKDVPRICHYYELTYQKEEGGEDDQESNTQASWKH